MYDETTLKKFNDMMDRFIKKNHHSGSQTERLFDKEDLGSLKEINEVILHKKYSMVPATNGKVESKPGTFVTPKTYSLSKKNAPVLLFLHLKML